MWLLIFPMSQWSLAWTSGGALPLCMSPWSRAWTSGGDFSLPLSQASLDKSWISFLLYMNQKSLAWSSGGALPLPMSQISLEKWSNFVSLYGAKEPSLEWWSFSPPYVSNKPGQVMEICFSLCLKGA